MADTIKINLEQLENDLKTLNQAIIDFKPYSTDFINNTRSTFEEFNSDFISKMDDIVKHLSEDVAKDILENVQIIYEKTDGIVKSFKEFDDDVVTKLK